MSESESAPDLISNLAHEFAERYRHGERPALDEYTQRYPDLAAQIRELFPALVVMEQFGSVAGEPNPQAAEGPIPRQLGEYRILREIGRGGMGIVYEAVQESLGRHVALKVLPLHHLLAHSHRERFEREAKAAAKLHHSNIVPVFGIGVHEGIHYYAMQYIQGHALDTVLQVVRRLRTGEVAVQGPPLPASDHPAVGRMCFSPDCARLACVMDTMGVQLWDLRYIRAQPEAMGLDWNLPHYPPARAAKPPDKIHVVH